MYDVLIGLMPPEVFAQQLIKNVIDQFAEMASTSRENQRR